MTPRRWHFGGRGGVVQMAGAIVVLAVACSSAASTGGAAELEANGGAAALPVAVPTPVPETSLALPPTVEVAPNAVTRTPVPPRRGRTPTPTPVYRPPETRPGNAVGLATTADNIADLYDPFQPEGDREIGYAQYRPAVPRDSITPIYVPRIRAPDDLQIPLTPEELVLGVEIDGESRAYPIGLMRFREMANDTLGGVPILVSW
ncbi:MAG: DUF3179 domain-containing protein [Chloroflexi bacterium]|nr:DUF3179 domain-containing protein [Chloroflexota bacterium]